VRFSTIGNTIQAVADRHKLGVVRAFVGHGVGTAFHSWPHVFHFK
jgi:methionyl aminopeptidase